MPTHHPDPQTLADYRSGRMSAVERLAVSDHLAGCAACRETLAATEPSIAGEKIPAADLPPLLPDSAPSYEEMAALLDGTLDETQAAQVRARLAAYPGAATEFADLKKFRDETAGLPPKLHGPGPAAGISPETAPVPGRIVEPARWRWTQLGALAAAAVLLLTTGWWAVNMDKSLQGTAPSLTGADLAGLPADLRHRVEQAARTGTVEFALTPANLRPAPGTLAGTSPDSSSLRQLSPVGQVVRETRPILRWTPRDGASSYVIYLVATAKGASVLRQEVPASATAWTPTAPLARGEIYEWQVEARHDGELLDRAPRPPAPEARFQMLDQARAAELDQVEKRFARDPLILGTAYARAGLEAEAVRQFDLLEKAHPDSPVAERLLQSARAATDSPQ